MNINNPKSLIEAAFSNPKETLHRGCILVPAQPLDLNEVMQSAAETDDERDNLIDHGPEILFEEIGWQYDTFFAFYWQSMGPMVWQCYLNLLHIDDDLAVVCRRQDAWPCWQAVAQVRYPLDPAVMGTFFKTLINENGAAFGIELFGSLPSNTDNMSGDTVPENIVRAAYWKWMKWAEKVFDIDWQGLAEEVSARARSPIMYPLELLKKFGAGANGDLAAWLEKRRDQNGQLSVRAKRAIFDAYFKLSYGPY